MLLPSVRQRRPSLTRKSRTKEGMKAGLSWNLRSSRNPRNHPTCAKLGDGVQRISA